MSAPLSPYAVICPRHARQELTVTQYLVQLRAPDVRWKCPACGGTADWDDTTYEAAFPTQPVPVP